METVISNVNEHENDKATSSADNFSQSASTTSSSSSGSSGSNEDDGGSSRKGFSIYNKNSKPNY